MGRLSKFFALVRNEYIKIFKKGGTFAVLALMLFVIIAFELMMCSDNRAGDHSVDRSTTESADYSSDISWVKRSKMPRYEEKIELLSYLQQNGISRNSWRSSVLMGYVERSYSIDEEFPLAEIEKIKGFVEDGDWKGCYGHLVESGSVKADTALEYKFRIEHDVDPDGASYKNDLTNQICRIYSNAGVSGDISRLPAKYRDIIALLEYQVDNDIAYNVGDYTGAKALDHSPNQWNVWSYSSVMIYVIAVAVMIFAGNIVANEHSQGTIKFLLVNPVKRWKILVSKLFTVTSLAVLLMTAVFIICGMFASFMVGTGGLKAAWLTAENGTVSSSSPLLFVILQWLLQSITMFIMMTLSFSLSTFSRKSSIAIALSIVALLVGNIITQLLAGFGCDWGRFLIFANLDINAIAAGDTLFYRQTVGFAVFVIIEHMAVFLITAFDSFRKKSI